LPICCAKSTAPLRQGLLGLLLASAATFAAADAPRGVAVTPRNFPNPTAADVDDAFRLARDVGQHAVFIYQWGSLDVGVAKAMLDKARQAGLTPVLGLSPTTLDQGRKELDVPPALRRQAGSALSFGNESVRAAYVKAAGELAQLEPPYLCLATEINLLALQRLPEYLQFAAAYKEAYREVKRVSPRTRVFVSFQWEWVRILDAKEPLRIAEHSKVIDIFRPELDLVGFTTYPAPFHDTPAQLPADYYAWMFRHIPRSEAVMLMEVGWPTSGPGSEAEQRDFVERLPELLGGINLVGIEWALLHDVQLGAFGADLNTVGLRYRDGREKPAHGTFRALVLP
jgi:hypothetical protein